MKALLIAAILVLPIAAACGGGGGDSGGSGKTASNAASTAAMAASFTKELTTMKQCVQDEVDGKSTCGGNLLSSDPISMLCNDVHTGRANQFPGADYTKFEPTCSAWADALSSPAKDRLAKIDTMITNLAAIK